MFHSQDIQVLAFLTIPWFTKSVTSQIIISTLLVLGVHFNEYRVHFCKYLLNHNLLTHQAWSIERYKHG